MTLKDKDESGNPDAQLEQSYQSECVHRRVFVSTGHRVFEVLKRTARYPPEGLNSLQRMQSINGV